MITRNQLIPCSAGIDKGGTRMDMWKFFNITHREHILCNPMSLEKLEQLITLMHLKPGARALDVATGKGEFLIRLAERYRQMTGTGVDFSPYCIADVNKKHQKRVADAQLHFLEMDGAKYVPETLESFDLVACIGARWIYGGHRGACKGRQESGAPRNWDGGGAPEW